MLIIWAFVFNMKNKFKYIQMSTKKPSIGPVVLEMAFYILLKTFSYL